jgi:phosphomannomutase
VKTVPPEIFKAYDVRGLYPTQIDEQAAYKVARAFARVLASFGNGTGKADANGLRVAVGHDMRTSSPALAKSFCEGLVDEGCQVLDIGMVGTEMVYYAVGSRALDGGVSVTASHNPKAWSGF